MIPTFTLTGSPYTALGGSDAVRALVAQFYDEMERHAPELAALHQRDEAGRITQGSRDRFALFLIGWLGGPQDYTVQHGHPRLRMRHGHLPVNVAARSAWLDSMRRALDARGVSGDVRKYLDQRFAQVADYLRNVEGE